LTVMEPNFTKLTLTWPIVKYECSEFYENLVKVSVPEIKSHRVRRTGGWKVRRICFPYTALLFFLIIISVSIYFTVEPEDELLKA
jgi:hypothetical protein